MTNILVAGGGGAIGGHLVKRLISDGHRVRAVDVKPLNEWWQVHDEAQNLQADLMHRGETALVMQSIDTVYDLAADMGGIGYITGYRSKCMSSVQIGLNVLECAVQAGVERVFYASSACIYNVAQQTDPNVPGLKESDAWPAEPEPGYGEEKLFTEQLCRYFSEDYPIETRIARYHNVYGPHGTWDGGREKAPAAICRKVALAKASGIHEIEIWGDGEQTRSFAFVRDCVEGTVMLTNSQFKEPMNIGSSELVTINHLVTLVERIAGVELERVYKFDAPQGVRGRNSDNTLIREVFGWEPSTALADGLVGTYEWIESQVLAGGADSSN